MGGPKMPNKGIEVLIILSILVGAFVVISDNSEACFGWTVTCNDTSNNVDKGCYTIYEIQTSFWPGCRSTYWVSFWHDGVPAGWSAEILDEIGGVIPDLVEIILSGTVSVLFSLKVTAPATAMGGEKAVITTHIRATDYYNQDDVKDVITTTTVNSVDQAPNPVILSESGSTTTTINLTWTESDEPLASFDRYELHMSYDPTFTPVKGTLIATISDRATTSYTVTGLSPESTYFFCVRVWDNDPPPGGPYFADSNILEASTCGINYPPAAVWLYDPTDVTNCEANLSWTQNADKDFACYEVHVSTTPGFTPGIDTLIGNPINDQLQVDFQVTGLNENTTYYFKVRVYDTGGLYSDSNEVNCKTFDYLPEQITLDDPYDTTLTSTKLKWSESCITDFGYYEIHMSQTPGFIPGPGTLVTSTTNRSENYTTITGLIENTTYYFKVRVFDKAGNYIDSNEVWDTTLQDTLPWITFTSPVNNDIGVGVLHNIVVIFSEPMNKGSVTFTCSPDPGGWSETWSNGDQTVTYSHDAFDSQTIYTFQITGGEDLAGNNLIAGAIPNPFSFVTEDIIPPYMTLTIPADSAINVDVTAVVTVTFSEPMDPSSVLFTCSPDPGGWSESWSDGDQTVTYSHDTFESLTIYTCEITAGKDLAGNDLVSGPVLNPWSFETGDAIPPIIIYIFPVDGATNVPIDAPITITFSEEMDTTSLIFTCTPDPGDWSQTWSIDEKIVTLSHDAFESLTHYILEITGAKDIAGNDLIAGVIPNPCSFDTGDAIHPIVVSTKPAKDAKNVPLTTTIQITFSEEMDRQSVEDALDATFSHDTPTWDGNTINLIPTSELDSSTEYTITIGTEAKDLAGNHLSSPFTLKFTTEHINNAPVVIVSSPSNDVVDDTALILWLATDQDNDPLIITLYFDNDNDAENGGLIMIISGLSNSGSYTWDTSDLSEGDYYIYVKANDGRTEVGAYSGLLTIDHPEESDGDGGDGDQGDVNIGDEQKDDNFPWILLWIIICIIVILTILMGMVYRQRGVATSESINCFNCGQRFTPFDPSVDSVKCPHCGESSKIR
jgi:hypothetical protein